MFKKIHHFFHRHYHLKYHGIYKHAKQLFVFDIILLGIAALLFVSSLFFLLWKPSLTDQIDLAISFTNLKSGEDVHIRIDYTNNSKIKLLSPTLAVRPPKGFVIDKQHTLNNFNFQNSTFDLQPINPGTSGYVDIYGRLWSEPKRENKLIAILTYTPENKNKSEQKITSFFFTTSESILKGQLTLATSSLPNQSLPFTYSITNTGKEVVSGITIHTPSTTNFTDSKTKKTFSLTSGETNTLSGILFSPDKPGNYSQNFSSTILINGVSIPQTYESSLLTIVYPQLDSEILLNKELSFVEPGSSIPVRVSWKNNSDLRISPLKLKINFVPSGIIDIQKTAREAGFKIEQDTLVIDSTKRTSLSSGMPGSTDTFDINLFLLPHFNLAPKEKISLEITPFMEGKASQVDEQFFSQPGKKLILPVASEVGMDSEVRYFTVDGEQLGRGPLPPHSGETTKYWLFFTIYNTTNPLKNIQFRSTLAPQVTFTGKQSVSIGDSLEVDKNTVTWNIAELPSHSKTDLYFEVSVTPSEKDVGKTIKLIDTTTLNALDEFTNKQFILTASSTYNQLETNDEGIKKGNRVVK